jgi:hypothetical protein
VLGVVTLSSWRFRIAASPYLKAFMLLEIRFCLSIPLFLFSPDGKIHFSIVISLWQSNGTVEKSSG